MSATCAALPSCSAAGWPRPSRGAAAARRSLAAAEARDRRPQGGGSAPLLRLPPGRGDARRRSFRRACRARPASGRCRRSSTTRPSTPCSPRSSAARPRAGPAALRLAALIELLYGSGLRATELVSLPRNAVPPDRPFLILKGKGGRERLVPISDRARAAVAEHAAHGAARRALAVPVGQEASEPGPALPVGPRARRRRRHPARADQPARAPPRLRHPFARGRRRPARGADAARPCRHRDHADLHPCRLAPADRSGQQPPPARRTPGRVDAKPNPA